MTIPITWRYLLAFYCLAALMGLSHELAHHVTGLLVCGAWGTKTFNSFDLAPGCRDAHPNTYWIATLMGPLLFNYLPMWIAVRLMRAANAGARLFGVSLVLSTIPALRLLTLATFGDEGVITEHFFGESRTALNVMRVICVALILPPLVIAWRTIQNRWRPLVFSVLALGVPVSVFYLVGIVLEDLILKKHVLADTIWGIPYMVLLAEALATFGYARLRTALWRPAPPPGALHVNQSSRV
jgi:hypothetical protein